MSTLHRASGDGGLGELLKLEPIKESSLSPPPCVKGTLTTKSTTTTTSRNPTLSPTEKREVGVPVAMNGLRDILAIKSPEIPIRGGASTTVGVGNGHVITVKSPTSALAGQLSRNLSIKSPVFNQSKLTALPKHMQAMVPAQLGVGGGAAGRGVGAGSKVCKTSSLLTSAMRFHSGNDGLNSILDGSPDPIPGAYTSSSHVLTCTCMYILDLNTPSFSIDC